MNEKPFKIAILGCGTVGGGTARILLDLAEDLRRRAGRPLEIARIVDLFPKKAAERHGLPLSLFAGNGADLSREGAEAATAELLADAGIDLVVETIGGHSPALRDLCARVLDAGKHLVTANKALLAEHGDYLFPRSEAAAVALAYEAAVCGAIPVIRTVREGFAGDEIRSISGIMNGTSNYILSRMQEENLSFDEALALAQEAGYAEADPTLDVGGGDAGHKLSLLMRLAFGLGTSAGKLSIRGIQDVEKADIRTAEELDCVIKLICHARRNGNSGEVYAAVSPMMVKRTNFLSRVGGATNAVRFENRYSGEHILVGKGAGSLETGSAVVADILAVARFGRGAVESAAPAPGAPVLKGLEAIPFPYTLIFDTEDVPGITGLVATAIGDQGINIDTVGHNLHGKDTAVFCVETMPCPRSSIDAAVAAIKARRPGVLRTEPKVFPVLY